jgi:thiol:disulfide interchange protein DsbD
MSRVLRGAAGWAGAFFSLKSRALEAASLAGAATLVLLAGLLAPGSARASSLVKTPHVTAELVAERSAVRPGESLQIGLKLQHIPHWHTYWRNPGDSGLPTTLQFTLPPGASTGEIEWPAPKRLPLGPLVNYGYEDELLLPLHFTAPQTALPGSTLTVKAQARWLVCNDVCIPEDATLELNLPVVGTSIEPGSTAHSALFAQAEARQPVPLREWKLQAQVAGRDVLLLMEPESAEAKAQLATLPEVHVFPFAEQTLETARHEPFRTPTGYAIKLQLMEGAKLPDTLDGVAVLQAGEAPVWGGAQRAAEFSAPVQAVSAINLPDGAQRLGSASATASQAAQMGARANLGWFTALLFAFLGGMVLNLMPCVFPVLSIKLLSLAQHHDTPHTLRTHALAYTGGVVLSFLALAAALIGLREAGSAIGWGFQLQEPGVVFVLALLFFVIGLNLMGAFEFGHLVPQGLANWRSQRPSADAFAAGVLAVVAASPCTAPFMGAALGYAITQSAAVGLSVFAALGLGMALPYVVLVLTPGWRNKLPRPGPWMLHLKQALAFPMFATVVWLVWVLGQQAGMDGAGAVLMALVGLAFVVWLGGFALARRWPGRVASVALVAALLAWAWPQQQLVTDTHGGSEGTSAEAQWLPYDEAVIEERVAKGQPVFVDFTAAWCVSCQVNKRLVLHRDDTMAAFAKANVQLMRADWTHRDERITAALAKLGRNGVPAYLLVRPGREPLLLPEVLTQQIVKEALATLASPG